MHDTAALFIIELNHILLTERYGADKSHTHLTAAQKGALDMNIEYFQYLQTVAESRSIRQAAEKLHLKQQYLSTIIKNIESRYDVTIFERSRRGIKITNDGRFFLERAQQINQLLQELESPYMYPSKQDFACIVKDIPIYIQDVTTSSKMISIIDTFHKYFPYVDIQLYVEGQEEIFSAVRQTPDSIGVIYTVDDGQTTSIPADLHSIPFLSQKLLAIASKQNKQAQQNTSISIHDFLEKELVLYTSAKQENNPLLHYLHQYGTPHIKYTVNNPMFLAELLQKGDYWAFGRVSDITQNELLSIPFQENIMLHSYFICKPETAQSFITQSFFKIASAQQSL